MKKYKLISIIAVCLLCVSIVVVYAAFIFNQTVNTTSKLGNIDITGTGFISYAPDVDVTDTTTYPGGKADEEYLKAIKKRRQDAEGKDDGISFTQDSVVCYATVKEGYNEEEVITNTDGDHNYFYLNQLGFEIKFKTDVAAFVRIHFSDAWIRTKTYNGNVQDPEFIMRDHFDLSSEDNNWVYDSKTNTQNYVELIEASDEEQSFTFVVDPTYYYPSVSLSGGHQSIMVQVSFTVDVIQANRAYKLWGYNPTELKNNEGGND